MNTELKLDLDFKKILPLLQRYQPYLIGLALIAVFGFTAYTINAALNVKPAAAIPADASTAATHKKHLTFDKATIESVKNLDVVQGNVPTGDVGKTDPFN